MDVQLWLERVRRCCGERHLPAVYVQRLVDELADHYFDLMEDSMRKDANASQDTSQNASQNAAEQAASRLGSPLDVAARAAQEYRHSRFCGRHPILAFVVLPIVSLPLLWAAALNFALLVGHLVGLKSGSQVSEPTGAWAEWCLPGVTHAAVFVPIAIAGALCCFLARRSAVGWRWIVAASLLIALLGSTAVVDIVLPGVDHKGKLQVGLGVSAHPSLAQVVQFLIPLCIGAWTIWKQAGGRRNRVAAG